LRLIQPNSFKTYVRVLRLAEVNKGRPILEIGVLTCACLAHTTMHKYHQQSNIYKLIIITIVNNIIMNITAIIEIIDILDI
jgi:hypothetical protein